jgi:hypothetical protein
MKQGIGALRQPQTPRTAELEVEQQTPAQANPVQQYEARVDTAAWRNRPTFYVISTKDKVIAPEQPETLWPPSPPTSTEGVGGPQQACDEGEEATVMACCYGAELPVPNYSARF